MNPVNTAFIRLSVFFIAGILAGFFIDLSLAVLGLIVVLSIFLFLAAYFRSDSLLIQDFFFGGSAYLLFFLLGLGTTFLHLPENQPNHYSNHLSPEKEVLLVSIEEELKPDLFNRKYIAGVQRIGETPTHGSILISLPKSDTLTAVSIDDLLFIHADISPVPAPLNPHQFNYQKFMRNRGVTGQIRLLPVNYKLLEARRSSLTGMSSNWRNNIVSKLKKSKMEEGELAILQALLLGQRQDISEEIYNNYSAAGVIHILAVSGLHIGIILWILYRILSPLDQLKMGRTLKTLLIVLLLWLYASLAGLSPSVVRAVTMFSFVAVGIQIKRRTSVLNSLFMSMMLLLLIRPQFLFEVGFQLSYLAVFSIVLFQPLLYNLIVPKNFILKYLWGIFTVTLAAQAGVLPLSLLYFHQFPGLFFLSNLVILPFLGLILATGIVVIVLALMNALPDFFSIAYGFMIDSLNSFVSWVAVQEGFLFQDIPFSGFQALAFYLVLLCLLILSRSPGYKRIVMMLSAVILLQLVFYYENMETHSTELLVFHKSRNTMIGKKVNKELTLAHNLKEEPGRNKMMRNYLVGEKINGLYTQDLKNVYGVHDEILLVVDSTGIYERPGLQQPFVLLSNSPKINLNRLLRELEPKAVIADGSNYKSYIQMWRETCKENNVPFHNTATMGAFIVRK